jgi:hypothetical protein
MILFLLLICGFKGPPLQTIAGSRLKGKPFAHLVGAARLCAPALLVIGAIHRHVVHVDVLLQKVHPAVEKSRQEGRLEVNVKVWFRPPVLIKKELVRIVVADVKVVLDAALFRARRLHEFAQRGEKIIALLWLAVQNGDQSQ